MENIITNPGLQHLAEKIFWNLDVEHLKICGLINQSCQQLLDDPMFWLRKFVGLSKDNQKDWIKVIQSVKNSEKEKAVIFYLQWNLKKEALVDLPSCRIIRFTSRMAFAPCWAFSYDANLPENWRFQNHLYCLKDNIALTRSKKHPQNN